MSPLTTKCRTIVKALVRISSPITVLISNYLANLLAIDGNLFRPMCLPIDLKSRSPLLHTHRLFPSPSN